MKSWSRLLGLHISVDQETEQRNKDSYLDFFPFSSAQTLSPWDGTPVFFPQFFLEKVCVTDALAAPNSIQLVWRSAMLIFTSPYCCLSFSLLCPFLLCIPSFCPLSRLSPSLLYPLLASILNPSMSNAKPNLKKAGQGSFLDLARHSHEKVGFVSGTACRFFYPLPFGY